MADNFNIFNENEDNIKKVIGIKLDKIENIDKLSEKELVFEIYKSLKDNIFTDEFQEQEGISDEELIEMAKTIASTVMSTRTKNKDSVIENIEKEKNPYYIDGWKVLFTAGVVLLTTAQIVSAILKYKSNNKNNFKNNLRKLLKWNMEV